MPRKIVVISPPEEGAKVNNMRMLHDIVMKRLERYVEVTEEIPPKVPAAPMEWKDSEIEFETDNKDSHSLSKSILKNF